MTCETLTGIIVSALILLVGSVAAIALMRDIGCNACMDISGTASRNSSERSSSDSISASAMRANRRVESRILAPDSSKPYHPQLTSAASAISS